MGRNGGHRSRIRLVLLFSGFLTACQIADAQREFVSFNRNTLDDAMQGGYGVDIADLDGDGLKDIVALATNPGTLVWYKNPGWQRYTITTRSNQNIDAAPHDIDGDGDVDLVLASEFSLGQSTEGGLVQWLENPGDPRENQEWALHYIDEIPTAHRVKWGDVNGDGDPELLVLPIVGVGASAPLYDVNLEFTGYEIPQDPAVEPWPGVVLDNDLQMAHGISLVKWNDDDREDILIASFQGIQLIQLGIGGRMVFRRQIGAGFSGERPRIGSSEVGLGVLSSGERFVAAIEPWHGNEVVVYTAGSDPDGDWERVPIETEFAGGHALVVADLDNDGSDEIIAGYRGEPYGLFIYRHDDRRGEWNRMRLDEGGIALAGLAIDDLDGDGFRDIIGIGGATRNVVYYANRGR